MSSIAYVTDAKMLEYHRLCRHRTILFWRLSSKRKITDFRKGDLLFFYSKPVHGRKKGLIGYAHYDSTKRLSLKQMWKQYGEETGYGTEEILREAIQKAARASKVEVPAQMRCLYLTDVVFFLTPVYPDEVGITIPTNLESYTYLDKDDPKITVKILEKARRHGIDLWSADPDVSPDEIFRNDVTRHQLAVISSLIGKEAGSKKEKTAAHNLAKERILQKNWEMIRGSRTDCLSMDKNKVVIAIPFVFQSNDRDLRVRELIGKITIYRILTSKYGFERKVKFDVMYEKPSDDVKEMVETINHE